METVSMDATGSRQALVVFDPVVPELSEGMLWMRVKGTVFYRMLSGPCSCLVSILEKTDFLIYSYVRNRRCRCWICPSIYRM